MTAPGLPAFADTLATTVLLHDPEDGRILDANEAAAALYGYPRARIVGMDIDRIGSSSPRFDRESALDRIRAAAAGDRREFEWQIRRSDGELRWVVVTLQPYPVDGVDYVVAEVRDATEGKIRARRVRLLNRLIRHNLRNDMNVVRGHAANLHRALEEDDRERQAAVIADVAEDVGEMADTVARIEDLAGNDESDFTPTRLDSLVEVIAAEYDDRFPDATVDTDTEGGVVVSADRGLRYGVEHAVENAVEHSEADAPWVQLRTRRLDDGDRAVVAIADEGPPIPEIEIEAVDAGTDITDLQHGTGVGLFAMQWCAESLGGKLDITHREPRGNLVEFTLPTADPVDD